MTEKTTKEEKKSVYETLSKIDVKQYLKKKMGLDYLSWATAWGLVKSHYPDAQKKITEFDEYIPTKEGWKGTGRKVDYRLTPFGCEVEVTVIIDGQESSSNLYVMDNKNHAVNYKSLNMGAINKAQQRCLVKALANAGLGLDVYAGEDLPSDETETAKKTPTKSAAAQPTQPSKKQKPTKQELMSYPVTFNGTKTNMGILLKHYNNGLSAAVKFADSLQGDEKFVFDSLKAMN
ncbi:MULTISPECIES: DUF1071 domain-containing protein [Lactobacillus]|uniref:DUF1071 domain-containing protein n=2 Tax=Lactobacillus xujianguonis TaxID=2495899 RepID=A0A437SS80_9LACO|nr:MULTISPECIES: DUF1071 domain-containing protein [Lactobacillus]RVU69799.1 DUF1071 domain-containing protein [Lactobacillus xujianguonis]RVU71896.1 DUF1071 domain-containing protein [Lactobacillus xujianguonis]